MSKEEYIEGFRNATFQTSIYEDIETSNLLKDAADRGLLDEDTNPLFAEFESRYPHIYAEFLIRSIRYRRNDASATREFVTGDGESHRRMSIFMAQQEDRVAAVIKKYFPDEEDARHAYQYYYLDNNERSAHDDIVFGGVIGRLITKNLPFLRALSFNDLWLKLMQTMNSRLSILNATDDSEPKIHGMFPSDMSPTRRILMKEMKAISILRDEVSSKLEQGELTFEVFDSLINEFSEKFSVPETKAVD